MTAPNINIPIYKLTLQTGDATGVDYVSLVDKPAIMVNWHAFNHQTPQVLNRAENPFQFKAIDNDKRIISGPIMVANLPMLRQDDKGSPYYAFFDAETISLIVQRFFKQQNTGKVNLMHKDTALPHGIYMFESFIIDSGRGINTPAGFNTLADGSWFGSYKVENDALWQGYIKTGRFSGFSIEGTFAMEPVQDLGDEFLIDLISQEIKANHHC